MHLDSEVYFSVDVETAGPAPGRYSLLSIGACEVLNLQPTFYVELQPIESNFDEAALSISGLSLERLRREGVSPEEAMHRFAAWVEQVADGRRPVFVAFNAAFDWMFVNVYFHRYLGRNPFGHAALDVKTFDMALRGVPWQETGFSQAARFCGRPIVLSHNALEDALAQAEIFRCLLQQARERSGFSA